MLFERFEAIITFSMTVVSCLLQQQKRKFFGKSFLSNFLPKKDILVGGPWTYSSPSKVPVKNAATTFL